MKAIFRITGRLFGIFILAAGLASPALGTELHIPAASVASGASLSVPVMLDAVDNLAGVKLVMTYDADLLTFKKADKTGPTSSLMHIVNDKKPGALIIVMAGAKGIQAKDFPILTLAFDVKAGLTGNHTTSIEITEAQMMSDDLKNIDFQIRTAPVTILPDAGAAASPSGPSAGEAPQPVATGSDAPDPKTE